MQINTDAGGQPIESEFSTRELIRTLWRGKLWIVAITTVFVVIAGTLGVTSGKYYKASIDLVVATQDSAALAGLSGVLSQISGPLGSLAGISANGGDQRSEAIAIIQSRAFTSRFIEENQLLPVLYASIWDPAKKAWRVDDPKKAPTPWKANEYFKKLRKVVDDRKTGLITMTITWTDPVAAAKWANGMVEMTNRYMRDKAIRESERNIAYLQGQVTKTDLVEMRNGLHQLIENEFRTVMLARGREDYALKVIDPAAPPEYPSSPRLLVWLLGGALGGLVVSAFLVLLRAAWVEPRR